MKQASKIFDVWKHYKSFLNPPALFKNPKGQTMFSKRIKNNAVDVKEGKK